jgi:hypothetical protein
MNNGLAVLRHRVRVGGGDGSREFRFMICRVLKSKPPKKISSAAAVLPPIAGRNDWVCANLAGEAIGPSCANSAFADIHLHELASV